MLFLGVLEWRVYQSWSKLKVCPRGWISLVCPLCTHNSVFRNVTSFLVANRWLVLLILFCCFLQVRWRRVRISMIFTIEWICYLRRRIWVCVFNSLWTATLWWLGVPIVNTDPLLYLLLFSSPWLRWHTDGYISVHLQHASWFAYQRWKGSICFPLCKDITS